MSTQSNISRRRRIIALGGTAIIASPLLLGIATHLGNAHAAQPAVTQTGTLRSYADIVSADKPAVVTITTRTKLQSVSDAPPEGSPSSPYDEFFRQFFGQDSPFGPAPQPQQPRGQTAMALGSGFIVSADGEIVTNNHVVDGATEMKVTLDDGKEYEAHLVGRDAKTDLAVIKIDASNLPTVSWGDSEKLRVGDAVLAIGNPFGIGTTVTSGIVSARGRDLHGGPYDDFIQVDAAINHGNSGGPLVDDQGKVVGINTAIYSPNGGNVGVGFAIPSAEAEAVVAKLAKGETIEHGYIGVQIQPVTKDVADALGMSKASGALVAQVVEQSPAARAGLRSGDVITELGGKQVNTPKDLSRMVADMAPGQKTDVSVWRKGEMKDLSVTLGRADDKQA